MNVLRMILIGVLGLLLLGADQAKPGTTGTIGA